jgi:hypothetical protein
MPTDTTSSQPKPLAVRRQVAAAMLGEGRSKIDELIATGRLDARKSGKNLLILVSSLESYVAGLPPAVLVSTGGYRKKATTETPEAA